VQNFVHVKREYVKRKSIELTVETESNVLPMYLSDHVLDEAPEKRESTLAADFIVVSSYQ
jgi:hypothetical protein